MLLILFPLALSAEELLVVEKYNHRKKFIFHPGEIVRFRDTTGMKISGRLAGIDHGKIILEDGFEITPGAISQVRRLRWGFSRLTELLIKAGIGYGLIGGVNRLFNPDGMGLLPKPVAVTGALWAGAALSSVWIVKKMDVSGGKWRIVLITTDEPFPKGS
ncbi:MAG: hypothetical protein Kow00127_11710 [Bacteroidales bacterium]